MSKWNPFAASQWIAWLGATVVACMGLTAFAYKEFETADRAKERVESTNARLDRIEVKVDRILERTER